MAKLEMSQQRLNELADYNSDTGVFTWNVRPIEHLKCQAAIEYDKAAIKYHGEFALTNEMMGLFNAS